jgi:regulator of cell morphogenesis and NO signaling
MMFIVGAREVTGMTDESLSAALEREHHEIDDGIERFSAGSQHDGALRQSITALRRHIYLEEEFLFPALRADGDVGLIAPIMVMLREHGQMWLTLDELERAVDNAAPNALELCHQLLVELQHHNMKEERIIYPAADQMLPAAAAARLAVFLGSSQLPGGWVCAKAHQHSG